MPSPMTMRPSTVRQRPVPVPVPVPAVPVCFNCDEHFTGDQTSDDFLNWEYCEGRKQWACDQWCRRDWDAACNDDTCAYCDKHCDNALAVDAGYDDDEHFKCVACEKNCIADWGFSNTCRECDAPCACAECAGTVGGCHYCAAHADLEDEDDDDASVLSICCDRCHGQMLREGRAQDTLMGYCESGRADCPCVHPPGTDPCLDFNLCGRCAEYNDDEGVVWCNDCLEA